MEMILVKVMLQNQMCMMEYEGSPYGNMMDIPMEDLSMEIKRI